MKDPNTSPGDDRPDGRRSWRSRLAQRMRVRGVYVVMAVSLIGGGAAAALLAPGSAGASPGTANTITATSSTTTGTGTTTTSTGTTTSITGTTTSITGTTTSTTGTTTSTTGTSTSTTGTSTSTTTTETSTSTTSTTAPGFTTCFGRVTPEPKEQPGEPNLLEYYFSCNGQVNSFTVTVDRSGEKGGTVDDFNPNATVYAGTTASTTEGFDCGGEIPSNGFNCNPQSAKTPSPMDAGDFALGTFDPIEPYCKSLPAKAKPGTLAIPQATVSIVVTDTSGYEEGPFTLTDTKKCAKVPNVVPQPKKKKKKKSKKAVRGVS